MIEKFAKSIILLIIIIFIASLLWLHISPYICFRSNNLKHYLKTDGFKSHLIAFPKEIYNDNVITYAYIDDGISCEIILIMRFDEDQLNEEVLRISDLSYKNNKIKYDNNDFFVLPTYIMQYSCSRKFEYASIDYDNNEVAYIFFENITLDTTNIDNKYIPKEFLSFTDEVLISQYTYSIYENNMMGG